MPAQTFLFFESGNYVKATRFFTEFQVKCRNFKKIAFDHCKTCSEHYEELAQEQNIALANFRRKKLSQTGIRGSNGNIKYLTFDEASYLAKVSRSMINKWADKGKFTVIKVGSRVRIRRDEFEDWMEQRDLERSMQ